MEQKSLLIPEPEMCRELNCTLSTLRTWRYRGEWDKHPPYKKIGAKIFFPRLDYIEWVNDKPTHGVKRAV